MTDEQVAGLIEQLEGQKQQDREAAARALGTAGTGLAVPALMQALDDKYTKVRIAAAEALGRIGDTRAIPRLIQALGDRKVQASAAASAALVTIGQPAVPDLLCALEDERATVRDRAAGALGRIGDGRAFSPLVQALDDRDVKVRTQAVWALQRFEDRRAIPHLVRALERKGNSSHWAAQALARWGAIAELVQALADGRAWVREAAVAGLRKAGPAAATYLAGALDDKSLQVRYGAATALAHMGDRRAIPRLQEMAQDAHLLPWGRRDAERLLRQLGDSTPAPTAHQIGKVGEKPADKPPTEAEEAPQEPQRVARLHLRDLLRGTQAVTWIDDLLERDDNVLLTPTWIAQAQKTCSQKMLMQTERNTLWPLARELMGDLWMALADETAREWAGTALALLDERQGTGAIGARVDRILQDPASIPRGHYEEGMHGFFRGLQFLLKSVFDVRLNPSWCEHMAHFSFPWQALPPILEALQENPVLRQRWEDLHRFYTVFTGTPDCVCICHLLAQPQVTPQAVESLAQEMGIPRINRKMGLGVQGLGERFTRHGVILERLKETFLPDISPVPIPRESVYAVVNMRSLLYGFEHNDSHIPGLLSGQVDGLLGTLAAVRRNKMASFFDQFLIAQYELVADLPAPDVTAWTPQRGRGAGQVDPVPRRRVNAFAANLASLLELSILSAKQPVKAVLMGIMPVPRGRIYVEEAPKGFFDLLCQAGKTVVDLCDEMTRKYELVAADGQGPLPRIREEKLPTELKAIYRILGELAESGRFIPQASRDWFTIAPLVERLKRNPNVAADAYRHVYAGTQYFMQWCTAMARFEAQMTDGTPVGGGELLFVEGWNDEIVPGRTEPLTNSAWREALDRMALVDLKGWAIASA